MPDTEILKGKRVLIVDDEPDVLESLTEMLDMCRVDAAADFETAAEMLETGTYQVAVLDIMGVDGYGLLEIARRRKIPAVMLTAHALSEEAFAKSIEEGAWAYLPKEKLAEVDAFLTYVLEESTGGRRRGLGRWFDELKGFYEDRFGAGWRRRHKGLGTGGPAGTVTPER